MDKKVIGRREFLKLAAASAVAVGLSHFRILNFGVGTTSAQTPHQCAAAPNGDACLPSSVPPDPDVCIEPKGGDRDICQPTGQPPEGDICIPQKDERMSAQHLLTQISAIRPMTRMRVTLRAVRRTSATPLTNHRTCAIRPYPIRMHARNLQETSRMNACLLLKTRTFARTAPTGTAISAYPGSTRTPALISRMAKTRAIFAYRGLTRMCVSLGWIRPSPMYVPQGRRSRRFVIRMITRLTRGSNAVRVGSFSARTGAAGSDLTGIARCGGGGGRSGGSSCLGLESPARRRHGIAGWLPPLDAQGD